ncbi:Uncharacterised protein [Candidatus Burarchaeum australiense]|nr:Uncharacterised protein [Candidatus Burarchaeum australiense]
MKGQNATEFLLTYSWAIIVVAVVIGLLAYLGFSNLNSYEPERCAFAGSALTCNGNYLGNHAGSVGNVLTLRSLNISNNYNKPVVICQVICSANPPSPPPAVPACGNNGLRAIAPGESVNLFDNWAADSNYVAPPDADPTCLNEQGNAFEAPVNTMYKGKIYVYFSYPGESAGPTQHNATAELAARVGQS